MDDKDRDKDDDNHKTICEENLWERRISIKKRTVVKRHVSKSELLRRADGTVVYPYWAQERLRNEAATLALVAERTTIPVPKCRLYMENDVLHLETTRITTASLPSTARLSQRPTVMEANNLRYRRIHYEAAEERELAFFGLKREDLKDCSANLPPFGWGAKIGITVVYYFVAGLLETSMIIYSCFFLRRDLFALSATIAGLKNAGKEKTIPRTIPLMDNPSGEVYRSQLEKGPAIPSETAIARWIKVVKGNRGGSPQYRAQVTFDIIEELFTFRDYKVPEEESGILGMFREELRNSGNTL
ncbi:hypothetical protein VTO42DRAFT_3539 [Malbranchea cinnamomea]